MVKELTEKIEKLPSADEIPLPIDSRRKSYTQINFNNQVMPDLTKAGMQYLDKNEVSPSVSSFGKFVMNIIKEE